ncbi:MAG: copper amine oxidase N-terminal domain-containing protein [Peptococcaceae bacterium]|nr:copper amine oxidase N-terminal domain-containing protein [Peptococcaceae bacterium]
MNGTTLVPLRAIFEALGAQVGWDEETRTVTAFKNDRAIVLSIGSRTGYVNNQPVALAEPARIEEGRTFVPLRFVSESLGADVKWVPETRQVIVTSQEVSQVYPGEPGEDNPTAVVIGPEEIRFE